MKFPRFLVTVALLASVTGVASAQVGSVSLWWDACGSTATPALNLNKQFVPGVTSYKQVISAIGAEQVSQGCEVAIKISAAGGVFPDAWRFEGGGCQQDLLVFSTALLSAACPKLEGLRPLPLFQYDYNNAVSGPNRAILQAFSAYDPFDPVGHAVHRVHADVRSSQSVIGPGTRRIAGGAEAALCHHITRHGFLCEQHRVNWASGNSSCCGTMANSSQCPGATPTKPATWGQIKANYHSKNRFAVASTKPRPLGGAFAFCKAASSRASGGARMACRPGPCRLELHSADALERSAVVAAKKCRCGSC
jgi:hypothetical protein